MTISHLRHFEAFSFALSKSFIKNQMRFRCIGRRSEIARQLLKSVEYMILNTFSEVLWSVLVLFHALFQICFIHAGEPAATFSQSCPPNPPKRASTTAEGFAHDLLMQEQQLLAKESPLSERLAALTRNQGWSGRHFRNVSDLQVGAKSLVLPPTVGVEDRFSFPRCKAKITGELLLARRRLDEERSKSDSLARPSQGFWRSGSENGIPAPQNYSF